MQAGAASLITEQCVERVKIHSPNAQLGRAPRPSLLWCPPPPHHGPPIPGPWETSLKVTHRVAHASSPCTPSQTESRSDPRAHAHLACGSPAAGGFTARPVPRGPDPGLKVEATLQKTLGCLFCCCYCCFLFLLPPHPLQNFF